MGKTYTDFSRLSKGMFKKSDPVVEVKPLPPKKAAGDDALAYFGLNAPEAPTHAPGVMADNDGRIQSLEANVAALRAESAALGAAKAEAERKSADLEQQLAAGRQARASAETERERRAAVLEDVLAANKPASELARRRKKLKQIIKDTGSFVDVRTIAALEKLGFKCVSGTKHWKLDYANVRIPISKTPSDRRGAQNTATDIANRCF